MDQKKIRILGVDPGTARLGYCILDYVDKTKINSLIDCGIISTDKDDSDSYRLHEIRKDLKFIIEKYQPEILSIEKLFFFRNLTTVIPVAQARGVVLELAEEYGLSIFEYTPLEMKKVITGDGQATKDIVSNLIHAELKLDKEIKPDDAVDAVGMALTFIRMDLTGFLASFSFSKN